MRLFAIAAGLALAAPVFAQEGPPPPYDVTGEPQRCIARKQIKTIIPIDERALYIDMVSGRDYRSDLRSACEYRPRSELLTYGAPTGQLCAGETAQRVVRADGIGRGFCQFGPFTPVRATARTPAVRAPATR